jgi:hypothetical protein
MLAGSNAGSVFHDMRRLGEIVICDAPPTLPVADASILAEVADVVLFVHDPAISSRTALEDAVRQLRTAGAEIAGGVYNNITSLQRTTLGYASYDRYYGPDDRAKGSKKAGGATRGSGTKRTRSEARPTDTEGAVSSNGKGTPSATPSPKKAPAATSGKPKPEATPAKSEAVPAEPEAVPAEPAER